MFYRLKMSSVRYENKIKTTNSCFVVFPRCNLINKSEVFHSRQIFSQVTWDGQLKGTVSCVDSADSKMWYSRACYQTIRSCQTSLTEVYSRLRIEANRFINGLVK